MTRFSTSRSGRVAAALVLAGLIGVFAGPYYLSLNQVVLGVTLFNAITMASAWNLIGGYGGQFSLGHAVFVGTGAYTTALVLTHIDLPLGAGIVAGGVVGAALAMVAAVPLLRLRGVYFAVGSLGIAMAAHTWMVNWEYAGATSGFNMPPDAALDFGTLYTLAAALAAGTVLVIALLMRSRFGMRLTAVRDDEEAAAELGVRGFTVKLAAFTLSGFATGMAGSLFAFQQLTLQPDSSFSLSWTIDMIVMATIGGLGTIAGPVIGAAVIFGLEETLKSWAAWSTLIEGVLLILIIRLAPGGLWGLLRAVPGRIRRPRARPVTPGEVGEQVT